MEAVALDATAGALAGMSMSSVFYGLDSYKVMKQAGGSVNKRNFLKGLVPNLFTGTLPQFATFFALYVPGKRFFSEQVFPHSPIVGISISSAIASTGSSLVSNPADVVKKRLVLGLNNSFSEATSTILKQHGWAGMFLGWRANLVKDVPFASTKLILYESLSEYYLKRVRKDNSLRPLSAQESALIGFLAGGFTGVVTCPLDCVNTRIKSGELQGVGLLAAHREVLERGGLKALFRGVGPRSMQLGFGSTVFWWMYAWIGEVIGARPKSRIT
jgi:solute carrier family 25 S-adenosylmethionine transporter 26